MKKAVIAALLASTLGLGTATVCAQSAKDESCNRAAKDELARCQKRLGPSVSPVDPKNPTAQEKKAIDQYEKAWKGCIAKSEKRGVICRG